MNRLLSQRREALISQAADQRRQLAYAFSGISYRLRFIDRGIGWFMRSKYSALLTVLALGTGLVLNRHKNASKFLAIAMIAWRAIRLSRKVTSVLRAAHRRSQLHSTAYTVDQDQRFSQRAS